MPSKNITRIVSNDKKEQFFENFIRDIIGTTLNFEPLFESINGLRQQIATAITFTNQKLWAIGANSFIDDLTVRQMVRELVDEFIDQAFDKLSDIHDDASIWGDDLAKPAKAAEIVTPTASKPQEELIVEISNTAKYSGVALIQDGELKVIASDSVSEDANASDDADEPGLSDGPADTDNDRPGFDNQGDDAENYRYRHNAEGDSSGDNDGETHEKRTRKKSEDNFTIIPGTTSLEGLNDPKLIERLKTEANVLNILELAAFVEHSDLKAKHYGPPTIGKMKRFLNHHGYKFIIRTDPSTHLPPKVRGKGKPKDKPAPAPVVATDKVEIPEGALYPINIAAAEFNTLKFLNSQEISDELNAIGIDNRNLLNKTSCLTLLNAGIPQAHIDHIDYGLKLCGYRTWDKGEKKFNPPVQ